MGAWSIWWPAVFCGVAILFSCSNVFRYYFKFFIFVAYSAIAATITIPFMLSRPGDHRNALFPAWLLRKLNTPFGLKWELVGKENLVQGSGSVTLLNHQSILDLSALAEIWPNMDRCTVVSKKEIFYFWPFGLAAALWGTIFIDRLNPERAKNTVNRTGELIRKRRARLLMFPEGTRYGGEKLLPLKKGAFHVAIDSQLPIQPVVVSRYYFLSHEKKIFNGGKIRIAILPAIPTYGCTHGDIDVLIEKTYQAMQEHYSLINNKISENQL